MPGKVKNSSSKETSGSFHLQGGEDSYTSQDAQSAQAARRLQSFFPILAGEMVRELGQAKYLPTQLPSKVTAVYDYPFNDTSGARQSFRFACTATALYKEVAGAWVLQTLPTTNGLTTTSPFADTPQFAVLNNLLHFADGTTSWIYDGPNNQYVIEGFPIPLVGPNINNTGVAGVINASVSRFYWITYADHTAGRVHESSTSPICTSVIAGGGSGPLVNKQVEVGLNSLLVTTVIGNATVTATSGVFDPSYVGMKLYINGTDFGRLGTYTDTTHMVLDTVAGTGYVGIAPIIAPVRATHIHVYCSETDGSKLGKFLAAQPVTANPAPYHDNTPFITDPTSIISNISRPIRNDPPAASKIIEVHKYRNFRRREVKPNFFFFSANEEVSSGNGNGSPQESYPGAAGAATLSDLVDEASYPQESNRLRAIKSHADALWLATEKGVIPLYGNSIDDFGLLQITTITGGALSRWAMQSTPHGLTILGYDRILKLYPPISPVYSTVPQNLNVTDQLIELGRPLRKKLRQILSTDQDNVRTFYYQNSDRDWLVVCGQDTSNVYHTYVYDFQTKAWWESQRGFVSLATFEPTAGTVVLVGGGTDGFVYVMDDLSGTYVSVNSSTLVSNLTCPAAMYRTALIDFTRPDMLHIPDSIEFELSNPLLANDLAVNFYLDPQDADNPGVPYGPMVLAPIRGSAARFRASFSTTPGLTGVTCQRVMMEFLFSASVNTGGLRGVVLRADSVSENLIGS